MIKLLNKILDLGIEAIQILFEIFLGFCFYGFLIECVAMMLGTSVFFQ